MLKVTGIRKTYENQLLLKQISFKVDDGEILCLLGPSGSGKTTLLRIIAGLESCEAGNIAWDSQDLTLIPPYKRNFGFVFQDYALFPHMTVFDNVAFGLRMHGAANRNIHKLVEKYLEMVHLEGFETRHVTDLSGGEQQRVALARALAPNPRMIMFDEPLAALDRNLREEVLQNLKQVVKAAGIPAIYVTHDQHEALVVADRIALLHDGEIIQTGDPQEIYTQPANHWVAEFLALGIVLEGHVLQEEPLQVKTSMGVLKISQGKSIGKQKAGELVDILIRTTRLRLESDHKSSNVIKGQVRDCVFNGESYDIEIEIEEGISIALYNQPACKTGKPIEISFADDAIQILEK